MLVDEAIELGESLLKEYQLYNWKMDKHKSFKAVGTCDEANKKISLSSLVIPYCTNKAVNDILLHEISHALVGVRNGHNKIWKQKCIELGGTGNRLMMNKDYIPEKYEELKTIKYKYVAVCKNGHVHYRTRMINMECSCQRCDTKFNREFILKFEKRKI